MGRALVQGGFIGSDVLSLKTRELGCGAGDWEEDWAEYSSSHHPRLNTGLSQASFYGFPLKCNQKNVDINVTGGCCVCRER